VVREAYKGSRQEIDLYLKNTKKRNSNTKDIIINLANPLNGSMYCYIFSGVDQTSNTPTSQQYVQCNKDKNNKRWK
jgi:hypothetical protein